jgi:hypothetical protein
LVRERLGEAPLLSQGTAARRRRRQRNAPPQPRRTLVGPGGASARAVGTADDAESTLSGAPGLLARRPSRAPTGALPPLTGRGAAGASVASLLLGGGSGAGGGLRSVVSQPDHVRLPEEYGKVCWGVCVCACAHACVCV